jgi:hypothetical protein
VGSVALSGCNGPRTACADCHPSPAGRAPTGASARTHQELMNRKPSPSEPSVYPITRIDLVDSPALAKSRAASAALAGSAGEGDGRSSVT